MPVIENIREGSYLYMPFDEAIDDGVHPEILNINTCTISTDIKRVGNGSLYLPTSYVQMANAEVANLHLNDFTIAYWEYKLSLSAYSNRGSVISLSSGPSIQYPGLRFPHYNSAGTAYISASANGSANNALNAIAIGTSIDLNVWIHWALSRIANKYLIFKNGLLVKEIINGISIHYNPARFIQLGLEYYSNSPPAGMDGYIDDLLIVRDRALFTDEFEPPTDGYSINPATRNIFPGFTFPKQEVSSTLFRSVKDVVRGSQLLGLGSLTRPIREVVKGSQVLGVGYRTEIFKVRQDQLIGEIEPLGTRSSTRSGVEIETWEPGNRSAIRDGIEIETFVFDSNAEGKYNLTVTPTKAYRNVNVNVLLVSKEKRTGAYQVVIGDLIFTSYGESNLIDTLDFNIPTDVLEYGNNIIRINFKYGTSYEYIQFEVVREIPLRQIVTRTFKNYDGGYVGDRALSSYASTDKHPCFLVPEGQDSTIIYTTVDTAVPLDKYAGILGVNIDAAGARVYVSFDGRKTWKSYIADEWVTVLIENIEDQGMAPEFLNSLLQGQWSGVFTQTQIDFAILLHKLLVASGPIVNETLSPAWIHTAKNAGNKITVGTNSVELRNGLEHGNSSIETVSPIRSKKIRIEFAHESLGHYWPSANNTSLSDSIEISPYNQPRGEQDNYYMSRSSPPSIAYRFETWPSQLNLFGASVISGALMGSQGKKKIEMIIDMESALIDVVFWDISNNESYVFQARIADDIVRGLLENGYRISLNNYDYAQYSSVFSNIEISGGEAYLKSITVLLPPNQSPSVTNIQLAPDTVHTENTILTAHIADAEGDPAYYRVLINGEPTMDYATHGTEFDIEVAIPNELLVIGTSAIEIQTWDENTYSTPYTVYITKTNTLPTIYGVLDKMDFTAMINDADGDKVRCRILMNGVLVQDWSSYASQPVNLAYTMKKANIVIDHENTLTLEVQDSLGESAAVDFDFVGQYYGLLFKDQDGVLLSDDEGNVLKQLDFGVIMAGANSEPQKIVVSNTTGDNLRNVVVTTEGELPDNPATPQPETVIQFDNTMDFTRPVSELPIASLNNNMETELWMRVLTGRKSLTGGRVNLRAKGEVK